MARFNPTAQSTVIPDTINLAGGVAYSQSVRLEIASILLTSFVQDKFYTTASDEVTRIRSLVAQDPLFAAKAAIYARTVFGMRSITHVVAGEILRAARGESWVKDFIAKVVARPDDATEIFAYYTANYGRPIPNALKKGLAIGLRKFDAYSIAKYKGESREYTLVDVVNLITGGKFGKSKALQISETVDSLVKGTLGSAETWETGLTKAGKDGDARKETWDKLLRTNKLGHMAAVRNIRNILADAPEQVENLVAVLVNERAIVKSKILPFDIYKAYREVGSLNTRVQKALARALDIAAQNIPEMPGKTLVVVDTSGSMQGARMKGNETADQYASLLAAAIGKRVGDVDFMQFSTNAAYMNLNMADSTMTIMEDMRKKFQSGGTNFNAIFDVANKKYDRIFIFSDMQGWMSGSGYGYYSGSPDVALKNYRKRTGANPMIYSFDLTGSGSMMFPEDRVVAIAGFSTKVFDMIGLQETDKKVLVSTIENLTF